MALNDLNKMRLGVLRELKHVHRFIDNMERSVKARNPVAIQKAYMFLQALTYHMDDGDLTPNNIAYNLELSIALQELDETQATRDRA
jgi:hypothetical protein